VWGLASLLALVLGAPAAPTPAPTPSEPFVVVDRIAAVVGDEIVLESEVGKLVAIGILTRIPGETAAQYRDRVLNDRIVDLLRERQLRLTAGLEPDKAEVDARIAALAVRIEKERGVPFDAFLAKEDITRAEVTAWIRRDLALQAYTRERLLPTVKITDADLKAFYDGPFREEARSRGVEKLPPLAEVVEQVRELIRERRLNEEIDRWTEKLRSETRIVIYRR
jgi:hypothetical protein